MNGKRPIVSASAAESDVTSMDTVIYIHGRGGSAEEAAHYAPLFPGCEVHGIDWRGETPWDAGAEIRAAVEKLKGARGGIILIANSIGAYFAMGAGIEGFVRKAYFISPVVDLEELIRGMMARSGVTEDELREKGEVRTAYGEVLSWEYLTYVREHPVKWDVPTEILYGSGDELTSLEAVSGFARAHRAGLTVMEGGEHWFHTEAQMRFLDDWIRDREADKTC